MHDENKILLLFFLVNYIYQTNQVRLAICKLYHTLYQLQAFPTIPIASIVFGYNPSAYKDNMSHVMRTLIFGVVPPGKT